MKTTIGYLSMLFVAVINFALGQTETDSSDIKIVEEVVIVKRKYTLGKDRVQETKDMILYSGKKHQLIDVDKLEMDLSSGNGRQAFARTPGIQIWENDGSGIQMNVSTRGLSPNRSWEFNVRQNGYDISSEAFGYPEAYYTPPLEAVKQIELIKGAASLQFGPQFGGYLNYELKKGNPSKKIQGERIQTIGLNGFTNSYSSIGGTIKKFSYYAFYHNRESDGLRQNSFYHTYTGYVNLGYEFSSKFKLNVEYTKMNYKSQQAGGLTDADYLKDPNASIRSRNWFSAPWNVFAATAKYEISSKQSIQLKVFGLIAERNSVGFLKGVNVADTINPIIKSYNPRQVDQDAYVNFGAELRYLNHYQIGKMNGVLAAGGRVYQGKTERNQVGIGSVGMNADYSITGYFDKKYDFTTKNLVVFIENAFKIGEQVKVIPGVRFEQISSAVKGSVISTGLNFDDNRNRAFLLSGLSAEYSPKKWLNFYGNIVQAYRPATFSELSPSSTTETVDPNLKDATGFNADFGIRGVWSNLISYDVDLFYLNYENRIGLINQAGSLFKTNVGTSVAKGIESYVEIEVLNFFKSKKGSNYRFNVFLSNSITDAKYVSWNAQATSNLAGKKVENVPYAINRFGCLFGWKEFVFSTQINRVGSIYTDALNTELPNATATIGKIAGYQLVDLNMSYTILQRYKFKAGVNNVFNEKYATRRATGYPGPGLIPGQGRTYFLTIGIVF